MATPLEQEARAPIQPTLDSGLTATVARAMQAGNEALMAPRSGTVARPAAASNDAHTANGVDPMDFVRANRIQVKDGSLFIDPYLVVHPRELDPAREDMLRKKLQLTYSINNPSFFESSTRTSIALGLGQLVPMSLGAKRSKLMDEVKKFNGEVDAGTDAELTREDKDKHAPFAAIVRSTVENPQVDPVGLELLKNGLSMYLLMREKLTQQGYLNKLSDYVLRSNTPDQVISDLTDKIGVSPLQVREAALRGGIDGVGKLLGLDAKYVADVKALTGRAAVNDFSYNMVEHWHLGRQLLGMDAPLQQKITTGMDARITAKIGEYRSRVRHQYDVPEPVKKEESRIAQALELVEPIQRALMYKLGYEICYSPEITADDIAFHKGVYGLHRKAANDLRDVRGTYRIYFSGKGDLKGSMRTLVHEIAHNLWPEQFSAQEVVQIDQLAMSDKERFARLQRVMDEKFPEFERAVNAYKVGTPEQKAAIAASAKEAFQKYGVSIDEGLLPYISDAHDFRFLVQHAVDTLSVEGVRYNRSGYDSTPERFREVISRFAELKQVEYRGQPQLLHYLAPGLDQVFEAHYLPHLKRVYQSLVTGDVSRPVRAANGAYADADVAPVPKVEELPVAGQPAVPGQQPPVVVPVVEQPLPKVAQRPEDTIAPITKQPLAADAVPSTTVDAGSVVRNAQTLSALSALDAMGIHGSATR